MLSLHTNKTDSSRAVMTRKLEIEKFGENFIFPYISLPKTVAIYGLTTYARPPLCPSLNVSSLYPGCLVEIIQNGVLPARGGSNWNKPVFGINLFWDKPV